MAKKVKKLHKPGVLSSIAGIHKGDRKELSA